MSWYVFSHLFFSEALDCLSHEKASKEWKKKVQNALLADYCTIKARGFDLRKVQSLKPEKVPEKNSFYIFDTALGRKRRYFSIWTNQRHDPFFSQLCGKPVNPNKRMRIPFNSKPTKPKSTSSEIDCKLAGINMAASFSHAIESLGATTSIESPESPETPKTPSPVLESPESSEYFSHDQLDNRTPPDVTQDVMPPLIDLYSRKIKSESITGSDSFAHSEKEEEWVKTLFVDQI